MAEFAKNFIKKQINKKHDQQKGNSLHVKNVKSP